MPWPSENEAQDQLDAALFVVEDTHGAQNTLLMLEREARRLRVVIGLKAERKQFLLPPPESAPAQPAAVADSVVDALKFYAEEANYNRSASGRDRTSAVAKDGGFIAREALASLAQDEEGE